MRIAPKVELRKERGRYFLASAPDGGACQLLRANRCSAHDGRPGPCREFPVEVHVGERLQASLVLSCPGIELGALTELGGPRADRAVHGLDSELAAVRSRVGPETASRVRDASRRRLVRARRLERQGRWLPEEVVREHLRSHFPQPVAADFELEPPPSIDDGLEQLPLFFDSRAGPVAIAESLGGWELLELRREGGVARSLGIYPPPDRPPALSDTGLALFEGYLRYWLERDRLFGSVLLAMEQSDEGDLLEWTRAELGAIGALTLARASVRARALGSTDSALGIDDIARGIRATDQDLLDRPTWGDRL